MKSKGFTLVELITVIVLIALIVLVVAVNMTGIQLNNNENEIKLYKERIASTACQYVDQGDNLILSSSADCSNDARLTTRDDCKDNPDGCYVCLKTLIEEGLVDEEAVDPYNNTKLIDEQTGVRIRIKWVDDNGNKRKECSYEGDDDEVIDINVQARKGYIYFNYGDGSGTEENREVEENVEFGSLPVSTWTGHAIDYWYYGNDESRHASPTDKMGSSDVLLTAHWITSTKTLTYNNQNGSGCTSTNGEYGEAWGTLCVPTRTNYTFSGWFTQPDGGGEQVKSSSTVYGNLTVYAKWSHINFTLTYDNQGGSGCTSKTGVFGNTWGTLCEPSRSGYTFQGWYSSPNGNGDEIKSNSTVNGDLTAHAYWKINDMYIYNNGVVSGYTPTTVTYSGSGPYISYSPSTITYNTYTNSALYMSTSIPNNYKYLYVHVLYTERKADWAELRLGVRPRTDSDGSYDYEQWFIPYDWYAVNIPKPSSSWQTVSVDLRNVTASSYFFYMHTAGTNITIDKMWFGD